MLMAASSDVNGTPDAWGHLPELQGALAEGGCLACDDEDSWDFSDHRPARSFVGETATT